MNASQTPSENSERHPAGVLRRLGAIVYDTLICVAVLMLATIPFVPFLHGKVIDPSEVGALAYVYRAWELVVLAAFFVFFWSHRGQTVGMQAWRLRVEDELGNLLDWRTALIRFAYGALPWILSMLVLSFVDLRVWSTLRVVGFGFVIVGVLNLISPWFDREGRSWHDKLSHSRVVVMPKTR
jgi:uncharacterized RDD family membrane protein YckC